jgi:hypothetical protein
MSRDALLNYATPPRHSITPRANWLAVFSFGWTFVVAGPAMVAFLASPAAERASHPDNFSLPGFASLVAAPAVAVLSGYVATERGAPWDSPYLATGLAVFSVPVAWVMTAVGTLLCFNLV